MSWVAWCLMGGAVLSTIGLVDVLFIHGNPIQSKWIRGSLLGGGGLLLLAAVGMFLPH